MKPNKKKITAKATIAPDPQNQDKDQPKEKLESGNKKEHEKNELPKLDQLNDIFQNNIKIYNNIVNSSLAAFGQNNQEQNKNASSPNDFSINDLLKSINPTTTKILESIEKFTNEIGKNPQIYHNNINKWITQITTLNFYFVSKLSNNSALPAIKEDKTDKRFSSEEWQQNLFFDFIKQFYLITSQMLDNLVESVEFPDPKQKALMQFYIKQLTMAMSPSNFVFTNPDVMMAT